MRNQSHPTSHHHHEHCPGCSPAEVPPPEPLHRHFPAAHTPPCSHHRGGYHPQAVGLDPSHHFAPRGLHWLALGVIATTLFRKGKGPGLLWFGLGALVVNVFMKRRIGHPDFHRGFGRRGRGFFWSGRHRERRWFSHHRDVSWKITVTAEPEGDVEDEKRDNEGEECQCADCVMSRAAAGRCSCGHVDEDAAPEVVFDAAQPSAADEKVEDAELATPMVPDVEESTKVLIEHRLDSLANSIEDLKATVHELASVTGSRASSGFDIGAAFEDIERPTTF